jgi:hypothetical protein
MPPVGFEPTIAAGERPLRLRPRAHWAQLHLWEYLAEFFSERKMFQTKVAHKIKNTFNVQYSKKISENRGVHEIM